MKKSSNFWQSLEKYGQRVIDRTPLPRIWAWVGVGLVSLTLIISLASRGESVVGASNLGELAEKAAKLGDYQLARELFEQMTNNRHDSVLGVESESLGSVTGLEALVYPELRVWRRAAELEGKLESYPGSKEIYLMLAELYSQVENDELANEYREKARVLDPNGAEFR